MNRKHRAWSVSLLSVVAAIVIFSLTATTATAAEFTVATGLADHQVLPRDSGNHADISVSGKAAFDGALGIQARVLRRGAILKGFGWQQVGPVEGQAWKGHIAGLPVGGPYTVEFRVVDKSGKTLASARVCDVLVGDLWILAGQSNMEGLGLLENVERPDELVHVFNMRYEWQVAEEPLHSSAESLDEAHWKYMSVDLPWLLKEGEIPTGPLKEEQRADFRQKREYGAGLGLPFAKVMAERTGVPIGLIPCAHGGASVGPPFDAFPGWDPALKREAGKSLYGAMLVRTRAAGGRVKGVLWWQGENDISGDRPARYEERFRYLISEIRSDFRQPDLPFYYVQIGRAIADTKRMDWRPAWKKIQQVQSQVEKSVPHVGMVPSIDEPMQDGIHISTAGLKVIGRRLANLACHDLFPGIVTCENLKPGPRPHRAHVEILQGKLNAGRTPRLALYVDFSDVNGRLTAPGRISGFSIRHSDGAEIPVIFRVSVGPAGPSTAVLDLGRPLPPDAKLWYGWGPDPFCNLTDEADMGVPAFGPIDIEDAGH